MASWSFTIPDALLPRVVTAICAIHHYQAEIPDPNTGEMIPNPETPTQFARKQVYKFLRQNVIQYEAGQAADQAWQTKTSEIEGAMQ